jgi:hypothetical protein
MEEARRLTKEAGGEVKHQVWHGTDLSSAGPDEMQSALAKTVLGEFKTRLARIGLEYQAPAQP